VDPKLVASCSGDKIASQVLGDGRDARTLTGTVVHVDIRWQERIHARDLERLASSAG